MEDPRPLRPGERSDAERMVLQEYAAKYRRKKIGSWSVFGVVMCSILGLVLVTIADRWLIPPGVYFVVVLGGLFLLISFGVFQMINWRCPRCQKQFGAQRNPRFCANCGVRLHE